MYMSDKVDRLFEEIEEENKRSQAAPAAPSEDERALAARLREERQSKISGFKLELDLGDEEEHTPLPEEIHEREETAAEAAAAALVGFSALEDDGNGGEESPPIVTYEEEPEEPDGTNEPQKAKKRKKKKKSRMDRTTWGCIRGIIYAVLVLGISGTLAYFAITGGIDMVGLNKSSALVDVEIPRGASTEQIADILKEKGLIDQPLIFRLYSKLTKADGGYRPGMFTLSANMGYGSMIDVMQSTKPRDIIKVTIPEGSRMMDIAKIMEAKGVCSTEDFYAAVNKNDYSCLLYTSDAADDS